MTEKTSPRPPVSVLIGRQLDQEKIDVLSKRVETLISSNNGLRMSAERNEKDTHDIVLYFQREMEMKDDIIGRLNEELVKKEGMIRAEADRLKEKYENEMYDLRADYEDKIAGYVAKIEKIENELQNLDNYKREKEIHDRKLAQLESELLTEQHNNVLMLEEQERKFLESKAQIMKELEEQKYTYNEIAMKEAREAMDAESKKLVIENKRISEELKFHNVISYEFQIEKDKLEAALTTARREVVLLTEKEKEYAKQNYLKTKEIKALRERVEQLENAQLASLEKYKSRTKEIKANVSKELEEATLDATGLRRLIQIKNKELRHMKTLAATILEQRSELEQFFLESLVEVKSIISERKKKSASASVQDYNQKRASSIRNWGKKPAGIPARTGTFPNIRANRLHHMDDGMRESSLPSNENDKVYMHELSWEDKELVLRLLFAKMNGSNANMNHAIQNTKRSSKSKTEPVFISEGKGIPTEDGDYQEFFSIPGYTDDNDLRSNQNYSIPMDQLNVDDVSAYEFGEDEGSKVNLA
mmetsp:Transcript_2044/g.2009  ORF Transcript_2044/g.2009 Transcript_2044/m.2009 type:complete len:531 (-) Transcript_2044:42-1634(-)